MSKLPPWMLPLPLKHEHFPTAFLSHQIFPVDWTPGGFILDAVSSISPVDVYTIYPCIFSDVYPRKQTPCMYIDHGLYNIHSSLYVSIYIHLAAHLSESSDASIHAFFEQKLRPIASLFSVTGACGSLFVYEYGTSARSTRNVNPVVDRGTLSISVFQTRPDFISLRRAD